MNLKHLGDALDGWKRYVIELLTVNEQAHVIPMFTDAPAWNEDHLKLYARLLRTEPTRIFDSTTMFTNETRAEYFAEISQHVGVARLVFVDPDNGPWTGKSHRRPEKYIKARELAIMLGEGTDRIVAVYRHESRSQTILGLQSYSASLFSHYPNIAAFGLLCGVTSLLCACRNVEALQSVRERFIEAFYPIGPDRVTNIVPTNT